MNNCSIGLNSWNVHLGWKVTGEYFTEQLAVNCFPCITASLIILMPCCALFWCHWGSLSHLYVSDDSKGSAAYSRMLVVSEVSAYDTELLIGTPGGGGVSFQKFHFILVKVAPSPPFNAGLFSSHTNRIAGAHVRSDRWSQSSEHTPTAAPSGSLIQKTIWLCLRTHPMTKLVSQQVQETHHLTGISQGHSEEQDHMMISLLLTCRTVAFNSQLPCGFVIDEKKAQLK